MSWELSTLLSVIVLCGTAIALAFIVLPLRIEQKAKDLVKVLETRVHVLESNQVGVIKIADEAKKMMSNQNLAQAVGGMRAR
jgi:hypothetical protein